MAKVALLIGVSEYKSPLKPLPGAIATVEVVQQVMMQPEMGDFEEVKLLSNPDLLQMQKEIEALFSTRSSDDLVLLFFSGHCLKDESDKLYFATPTTHREQLATTAIAARFVQELASRSSCKRQVLILDCCLSSATVEDAKPSNCADIQSQLAREALAVLISSSSCQNFCQLQIPQPSVYTHYLVEGIKSGAAAQSSDGWISLEELHEYINRRVKQAAPALQPEFYPAKDGNKVLVILLAKARVDSLKLKYRHEVERRIHNGEISGVERHVLETLAWGWRLTREECAQIEAEVLKPYREYREKLHQYEQAWTQTLRLGYPLSTEAREELRQLQHYLALTDKDIAPIEANSASSSETSSENVVQSIQTGIGVAAKPEEASLTEKAEEVEDTPTPPRAAATFPNQWFLIGLGGTVLAILAVVGSVATRVPMIPADDSPTRVSPSPKPANTDSIPNSSPTAESTNSSTSPEPKRCSVFINGNVRSEPASFRNNVILALRQSLPVTGKQTQGGWVEIQLPNTTLGWVHREIIADDDEESMDACLSKKEITPTIIPDISPPASTSSQ